MVNMPSTAPSVTTVSLEHQALLQRLKDVGYNVLEVQSSESGVMWTLEPLHSRVEFQLVGKDELLRFLDHLERNASRTG